MLGYLLVFISRYVHRERHAVFLGEFVDGGCDFRGAVAVLGRFGIAFAEIQQIEVVGGIYDCGCARLAAVVVDEDISHYREHPKTF